MQGHRASRPITVLLLTIGAMLAHAVPATADSQAVTKPYGSFFLGDGAASFRTDPRDRLHKGDTFSICDRNVDGFGIIVEYWVHGKRHRAVNHWGSRKYNGCRDVTRDYPEGTLVRWRVCIARYANPGGRRVKAIKGTCRWAMPDAF